MEQIQITSAHIRQADSRAVTRMERGLYDRMGQTPEERLRRARDGAIGEIAFEQLLLKNAVRFESTLDGDGPDEADFLILPGKMRPGMIAESRPAYGSTGKRGRTVDVKIALTDLTPIPEWCFGFPFDQHPEKKDVLVVGYMNTSRTQVQFWGCIAGELLKGRPQVTHNCYGRFEYETLNVEARLDELDRTFALLGGFTQRQL